MEPEFKTVLSRGAVIDLIDAKGLGAAKNLLMNAIERFNLLLPIIGSEDKTPREEAEVILQTIENIHSKLSPDASKTTRQSIAIISGRNFFADPQRKIRTVKLLGSNGYCYAFNELPKFAEELKKKNDDNELVSLWPIEYGGWSLTDVKPLNVDI